MRTKRRKTTKSSQNEKWRTIRFQTPECSDAAVLCMAALPAADRSATELKRAPRKLVDLAIFNLRLYFSIKSSEEDNNKSANEKKHTYEILTFTRTTMTTLKTILRPFFRCS